MRTAKDTLAEYRSTGENGNAARYLRFLVERDRGTERRYPDPKSKSAGKSGDFQITRSLAIRSLRDGSFDDRGLLAIHIRDAFQEREGGDSIEDRQQRAIEVFEAILDAARSVTNSEQRNFFLLVDAAADFAIRAIETERRFPSKEEVLAAASKATGLKRTTGTEGSRILAHAHLAFLPREKAQRGTTEHSMKSGFKRKIKGQ